MRHMQGCGRPSHLCEPEKCRWGCSLPVQGSDRGLSGCFELRMLSAGHGLAVSAENWDEANFLAPELPSCGQAPLAGWEESCGQAVWAKNWQQIPSSGRERGLLQGDFAENGWESSSSAGNQNPAAGGRPTYSVQGR